MVGKILDALLEVIDGPEFRELLTRTVLAKYGPELEKLAAESSKDTIVDPQPQTNANLTAEGLAWHFQSKLTRRPNSQEGVADLAAQMQALLARLPGETILNVLMQRGRSPEPIWKFIERFKEDVGKSDKRAAMVARVEETRKKNEAADGIPVDTRRLSRRDPRFCD